MDLVVASRVLHVLHAALAGVEGDNNSKRSVAQRAYLDEILDTIPVTEYDTDVARAHAKYLAHTRRVGRPRGAHDLIIAATALATDRTLLTTDGAAGFDELPGLRVRVVGT